MEKEALKRIFEFLKEKEGKSSIRWKIIHNEPFTEDEFTEEELIFDEYLNLSGENITSLPKGLEVIGNLYLRNCTSLTSLPEGLSVWGTLDLLNCKSLTSLPEGIRVGGLDLTNCTSLTSLPEGLVVGRNGLNLTNCKSLTSLPKGLKVSGKLQLKKTPLAELSDESLKDMIGLNGYIEGKNKRRRIFK
jgi:hypothetical protein